MYIITRAVNEYNQEGQYFVAAYNVKPTFKQLKELLNLDDVTTGKLTRGGGRQDNEYDWYYLKKVQSGQIYE